VSGRFLRVLALTLPIALSCLGYQPEIDQESYAVYSAVLRIKEPRVATWAIARQTLGFKMCLALAPELEPIYQPIFDDYVEKNKTKFALDRKFNLPDYTLVEPEGWGKNSAPRTFAIFSAVGFDHFRTHAAVCFWARSSGTCYALIKKDDAWQLDRDWPTGCNWAA
jgi:hypothetical protein